MLFVRLFFTPSFFILLNSFQCDTESNADFRSMYNDHTFRLTVLNLDPTFSTFLLYLILFLSELISFMMFTSHPNDALNPVYSLYSFSSSLWPIYLFKRMFKIVSNNLYIGEVFVMGLVPSNDWYILSSFGIYSCYSRHYLYGSDVLFCRQSL